MQTFILDNQLLVTLIWFAFIAILVAIAVMAIIKQDSDLYIRSDNHLLDDFSEVDLKR